MKNKGFTLSHLSQRSAREKWRQQPLPHLGAMLVCQANYQGAIFGSETKYGRIATPATCVFCGDRGSHGHCGFGRDSAGGADTARPVDPAPVGFPALARNSHTQLRIARVIENLPGNAPLALEINLPRIRSAWDANTPAASSSCAAVTAWKRRNYSEIIPVPPKYREYPMIAALHPYPFEPEPR